MALMPNMAKMPMIMALAAIQSLAHLTHMKYLGHKMSVSGCLMVYQPRLTTGTKDGGGLEPLSQSCTWSAARR